jgi:hypothetical protein
VRMKDGKIGSDTPNPLCKKQDRKQTKQHLK